MFRVPASPKLFAVFAEWALAQNDPTLFEGAESWHDAPDSGNLYGERAVRGYGDKYNRIGATAWERFIAATGIETIESTVFSDRTGGHRCVRLVPKK